MDRLIGLIFALYIAGAVVSALMKKLMPPEKTPTAVPRRTAEGQRSVPRHEPAPEQPPTVGPTVQSAERLSEEHASAGAATLSDDLDWFDEDARLRPLASPDPQALSRGWTRAGRSQRNYVLTPRTVRQAIIFAELLAPPRAARPYAPPVVRRWPPKNPRP